MSVLANRYFYLRSQVCVDDLENSRSLSLDMNEYLGTEIIFAFRDIKLIWNKKLVYILVKEMCDLLSLSFSKKHEKSVAQPE